jgi:hypothetical protein
VEIAFAMELHGQQVAQDYSAYLWIRRGKVMDVHMYTDVLKQFTNVFLRVPLGVSDWRQLTKNIFWHILHICTDDDDDEHQSLALEPVNGLVDMFGHNEPTTGLQFYGLQYSHLGQHFDETVFVKWLQSAIRLHGFQGLVSPVLPTDGALLDKDLVHIKLNELMTHVEKVLESTVQEKEVKEVVQKELGAAMKTDLFLSIMETVIQALSPYATNLPWDPMPIQPVIAVHPPQRVQTLRELLRDANAQFKSPHQAELFELVCQGKRHVIGVLPTGGGKSIAIFGPPKLEHGMSLITPSGSLC